MYFPNRDRLRRRRPQVRSRMWMLAVGLLALPLLAGEAEAQRPQAQSQRGAPATENLTLVYDREVFLYVGSARRDPFLPLTDENEMGPRFEALQLQAIIYSTGRRGSVALLADGDGRVFRVRVGDTVGNSTVVEIGPLRVVMAVENFGTIRQEMLELQKNQGARR